jgi:hypothetical protein
VKHLLAEGLLMEARSPGDEAVFFNLNSPGELAELTSP